MLWEVMWYGVGGVVIWEMMWFDVSDGVACCGRWCGVGGNVV